MGVVHEEETESPPRRIPRFVLILGILVFCVVGQFLVRAGQSLIGAIFIVLAAIFFVVMSRHQPGPGDLVDNRAIRAAAIQLELVGRNFPCIGNFIRRSVVLVIRTRHSRILCLAVAPNQYWIADFFQFLAQ